MFVGGVEERLVANKAITQHVLIMAPYDNKNSKLQEILRSFPPGTRIIIFCSTKRMCDQLSRDLRQFGAAAIHGDKKQSERDWVINGFKSGSQPIMVATDVAARGLDVSLRFSSWLHVNLLQWKDSLMGVCKVGLQCSRGFSLPSVWLPASFQQWQQRSRASEVVFRLEQCS